MGTELGQYFLYIHKTKKLWRFNGKGGLNPHLERQWIQPLATWFNQPCYCYWAVLQTSLVVTASSFQKPSCNIRLGLTHDSMIYNSLIMIAQKVYTPADIVSSQRQTAHTTK